MARSEASQLWGKLDADTETGIDVLSWQAGNGVYWLGMLCLHASHVAMLRKTLPRLMQAPVMLRTMFFCQLTAWHHPRRGVTRPMAFPLSMCKHGHVVVTGPCHYSCWGYASAAASCAGFVSASTATQSRGHLENLARLLYRATLQALPASARSWFTDIKDKRLAASLEVPR